MKTGEKITIFFLHISLLKYAVFLRITHLGIFKTKNVTTLTNSRRQIFKIPPPITLRLATFLVSSEKINPIAIFYARSHRQRRLRGYEIS